MLYQISHFTYDDSNGIINKENEEVKLTSTQKNLLNYFIAHPNSTISKQTLMDEVWGKVVTMNSIERAISILRSCIEEDASQPRLLITYFGHGISFEGDITKLADENEESKIISKTVKIMGVAIASVLLVGLIFIALNNNPEDKVVIPDGTKFVTNIAKNQSLLILPTVFENTAKSILEQGSNKLFKTTIDALNTQSQVWFDDSDKYKNELIEKNWKIDKDLIMAQSLVVKNGDVYDVVMHYTKGYETIKTEAFSATNLIEVTNLQLQSVSQFHLGVPTLKKSDFLPKTNEQKYLEALGYQKSKNYKKSIEILNEILSDDETSHLVRYTLADVLLDQQKFDESLSHLMTLKNTDFYNLRGGSIEFMVAIILNQKSEFQKIIGNVNAFFNNHKGELSPYRRAKLILQKAGAHLDLGNIPDSLKQYKLAIIGLDDRLYPDIYSSSFLGQGVTLAMRSSDDEVVDLFYQSIDYSKKANDLRARIIALNALSNVLYAKNDWQEGIKVIKESIALMDLEDTEAQRYQTDVAYGLGVLSMYLYERGLFSESSTVLMRLDKKAKDLKSDTLHLLLYNNQAYQAINQGNYDLAQIVIDKFYDLATSTNNYGYILNSGFVQLELLLRTKNTTKFMQIYDDRIKLFEPEALERYKIHMHWFLARNHMVLNEMDKASIILMRVSELALSFKDTKLYVDSQISLAKSYLEVDPKRTLSILDNVVPHNPNPNPYLWIKAKALVKLNRNLDAISALNQAKLGFNEAWSAENEALLNQLQTAMN